ncbi:hypothetical protein CK203_067440 [Vitis vinifera]|uniref:BED-type domain-containing protein n=1 Tax=Vitis vinifera TaxID=29760 RepID=A0A438EB46_VITVI|nr:hypothetical protein CK203_067440 [Vitis vinifera]
MESNLTPSSGQDSTTNSQSTRSKIDPAWEHVSEERYANGRKALICLYCKKITKGGGIHRMKQHLAGVKGDIGPWDGAEGEEEVQQMQSPMAANSGKRKKSTVDKYFAPRNTQGAQPSMRSVLAGKEAIWRADMAVGRFFYDACIPTNAVNSFYFKPMLDAISAIGPGYKGPNYHQLRVNLLKDAKKEVQLLVDSYRAIWAKVGCTIMGDGWTDNRQRTLINFLVYCPEGISFVKSVDASDIVNDATNLFQLFDEVIEWVGPLNVVHIVTDNAANYVAAGRLISQKHKHINWSPCAAHCLNLIFKDIGKMDHVAELVRRASKVTIFVYNHVALLSWLRKREGWTEILRPGATRFASTFIALKSLHDHKHDLQALVTSKFFVDSRYSKDYKSQVAVSIILDNRFWNDCLIVVNLMSPLMRLLRIVDCDERPSMGYVYEGMYSIHSAAYWLNPCFQYDEENFCNKPNVIGGVMDVIDQKVLKGKLETMNEMKLFRDRLGSFGRELAYSSREVLQSDEWWRLHGYSAPHLQKLAILILSQTASSSGCERNWSVFERIHTKRRNRLEHQRLNDLVYVHYNLRLKNRFYNKKRIYDPIDYACIDETDFWVVDDDQPAELDVEELENLLYEEGSIPINEVEGSSSHIDDEDGGDVAIEGLDVENFGFPNAHVQSPYSNFQNE